MEQPQKSLPDGGQLTCGVAAAAAAIRAVAAGEVTAAQALLSACEECSKVCNHVGSVFDQACQQHLQAKQQQQPGQDDMAE